VTGHIELGLHLIILRMTGNFGTIEVVRTEVVVIEGGIHAEMSGTWGSYPDGGQVKDVTTCGSVERIGGLPGQIPCGDKTAGSSNPEGSSGDGECRERIAFLMFPATSGENDGTQGVVLGTADINFVGLAPYVGVLKSVRKKIGVKQIRNGDLRS